MDKNKRFMKNLVLLVVVCLVIISLPLVLKSISGSDGLTSSESYKHMNIIENPEIFSDTGLSWSLYHTLMSVVSGANVYSVLLIQIVLGLISFYMFLKLLQKMNIGENTMIFSLLILISSPVFIYSFTTITPEAFILPLFLGAAYLFNERNYWFLLPSIFLVLVSMTSAIVLIVLFFIYYLADKNYYKQFFIGAISVLMIFIGTLFVFGQKQLLQFIPIFDSVSSIFVTMGAEKGYSFIILVLAFIGTHYFWKKEITRLVLYSSLVVLGTYSYFFPETRVLLMLGISLFAGNAISIMVKRKWHIDIIKDITLLLVVCSIIFAAVIFVKAEFVSVNNPKVEAAKFLTSSDESDVILSSVSNGYLIEYYSGRETFLDKSSYLYGDYDYKQNVMNVIFHTRKLGELESWLRTYNITHIFVDTSMTQGEIWNSPDEGVLFLLKNSDTFVKVFNNEDVQIYRYIGG